MTSLEKIQVVFCFVLVLFPFVGHGEEAETVSGSYWYIVDNIKAIDPAAEGKIWMTLPLDRPAQRINITNITPEPLETIVDEDNGNHIIVWQVSPPSDTSVLLYHFDFTADLQAITTTIDPGIEITYDQSSTLYRRFTRAEIRIETDGAVGELADEIVGSENHPYRQAKLIYDWMVANLEFVPGGYGEKSARTICLNRRGDCTQYSLLFTALCRSQGIPARTLTCAWLTGGKHVLAEFYLPTLGWLPADPSVAQLLIPESATLTPDEVQEILKTRGIPAGDPDWLFGNLYRNRLLTTVGNNIEVVSTITGEKRVFTFLQPGGIHSEPPAYEFHGFNPDIIQGGFYYFGEKGLTEDMAHDLAHQKLADSYFAAGLYEQVEEGCLKILEGNPDGVTAWINLGRVYLRKGEYNQAEASFKRALTSQASVPKERMEILIWVHNYLGNCYDLIGRRNLALAEYQQVVDLDNNYRGAVEFARKYINSPFTTSDF